MDRRRERIAADPVKYQRMAKAAADKNREYWNQWRKDYYQRNKEMWRGIVARRRALELNADGVYTVSDIAAMYEAQAGLCNCCRVFLDKYHVDHVIPLSRGGTNYPDNLQLLCPQCNWSKADKLPDEFAAYRAGLGLSQDSLR